MGGEVGEWTSYLEGRVNGSNTRINIYSIHEAPNIYYTKIIHTTALTLLLPLLLLILIVCGKYSRSNHHEKKCNQVLVQIMFPRKLDANATTQTVHPYLSSTHPILYRFLPPTRGRHAPRHCSSFSTLDLSLQQMHTNQKLVHLNLTLTISC